MGYAKSSEAGKRIREARRYSNWYSPTDQAPTYRPPKIETPPTERMKQVYAAMEEDEDYSVSRLVMLTGLSRGAVEAALLGLSGRWLVDRRHDGWRVWWRRR